MLDLKDAVTMATQTVAMIFPQAHDLRLEEVELSDEGPWWDVTLSFPQPPDSGLEALVGRASRAYKLVRLNRDTGEFHAVKIRKV